jgi:hypothetical protein
MKMNTYADDLAALIEKLDLKDAIHVGHPTAGAPHGMCSTLKDQVNAELLAFFKLSGQVAA